MKLFTFALFILIGCTQIQAQNKENPIVKDSVQVKKTIAVVPFMPQMYYNDLSRLWYKTGESHCQEKQISEISQHLAETLNDSLGSKYGIVDLNISQTISTTDFLLEFYLLAKFAFTDTFPQIETKVVWPKNKPSRTKRNKPVRNGEVISQKEDRTYQFLNVNIRDKKKFRKLCKELGVDEVLFINQFDVKGKFGSYSSGRETDYFINIHYALYDNNANLILGNKTKFATTNEKARYTYFLDHDLKIAASEITKEITKINKVALESGTVKKAKAK